MSMEQLALADVKNRFSEVVERISKEHDRIVVTKHGHPAVVILSVEDLESLEETLEVLSNPELMSDLREAEADAAAGRTVRLSKDEAIRLARGD